MNLGDVVYKLLAGRTPTGRLKRPETTRELIDRGLREAGGVSQLARAIGVDRTTVQRWNKGSTPSEASVELLRTVLRKADVNEERVQRIVMSNRLDIKGEQDGRPRTVHLGRYLERGTMQRAADAFIRGAGPAELHTIVWSGISGAPGYRWMFQPPGWAQMSPGERLRASGRAEQLAEGPSGGGGAVGASGGAFAAGELGEEGADEEDEDEDDYLDEYDYDYEDVAYDGETNAGYEFAATSAKA